MQVTAANIIDNSIGITNNSATNPEKNPEKKDRVIVSIGDIKNNHKPLLSISCSLLTDKAKHGITVIILKITPKEYPIL